MQLSVTLTGGGGGGGGGGGATGLRLTEEHRSIVIAKVRKGGRGDEAGLREGDVVLSVNGRSCQGAGASVVSQWIDNSGQKVTIQVLRDDSAAAAAAAAAAEPEDHSDLPAPTKIILRQEMQPEFTVTAPSGVSVQQNTDKSFTMTIGMPFQLGLGGETKGKQEEEEEEGGAAVCSETRRFPPKQLEKILAEGIGSEPNTPDEPPRPGKKLFVDSAFYDDPEHKYPTVEEQIQLARQVALSVISPANLKSKGHRMFMKRKERAIRWTTGLTDEEKADLAAKATDTVAAGAGEAGDEAASYSASASADQSPPSAMPTSVMFAPKLPKEKDEDRMNAMSNEELERMLLLERKTTHTNVSPQVCFSLVDDLKSLKGKGGKLFAKRQARAEKWDNEKSEGQEEEEEAVQEEAFLNRHSTDNLKVEHRSRTKKADGGDRMTSPRAVPPPTVNRLKELIDAPKAVMTPWDAAAQYGSVEKAFEHLEGKQKSGQQSLADALQPHRRREGAGGAIRPKSTIGGVGMGRSDQDDALGPEDRRSKIEALGGNPNAISLASAMSASLVSASRASKRVVGLRSERNAGSDPAKNAAADHSANRNSTIGT